MIYDRKNRLEGRFFLWILSKGFRSLGEVKCFWIWFSSCARMPENDGHMVLEMPTIKKVR